MFIETAYGCWAMYVSVQQATFRSLPAPVFVPSTISGFALMLFPWFVLLLHMPRSIRDGLVANLIVEKLGKVAPDADDADEGGKAPGAVDAEAAAAVAAMTRTEQLTSVKARVVGGSIMVGALAGAAWITAIVADPSLVSDVDGGFDSGENAFGHEYYVCQTQEYDWKYVGRGATVRDDAYHRFREAEGAAAYVNCDVGSTGICATNWQRAPRASSVASETRPSGPSSE